MSNRSLTTRLAAFIVAPVALVACGGDTEFVAMDADGVADVVDASLTEESGLRGLLSASDFTPADVEEFNSIAEEACSDLSNGIDADEYEEFKSGVMEGAGGVGDMIDVDGLTVALVEASCPSYLDNLSDAIAG